MINDKNFNFNSDFWQTVFKQCKITLNIITIYHFSTNEQIEKSNQIVKTALKNLLIKKYEKKWKKILFHVEYSLNVFQNASIETFSFEILYGIKFRNSLLIIIKTDEFQKKTDFIKKKTTDSFRRNRCRQINTSQDVNFVRQKTLIISFERKNLF